MTVSLNPNGSTRSTADAPFKKYVRLVWEEDGMIDLDDFDPSDRRQIKMWVSEWETER
jgi:hypothetical protein